MPRQRWGFARKTELKRLKEISAFFSFMV